ncbi:WD repeat protein, partial [Ichthyophthirius multifiliis]
MKQYNKHQGPIWKINWAHPHFGNILASCSYDKSVYYIIKIIKVNKQKKVAIHKERQTQNQPKVWETVWKREYEGSINYLQFSPYECGFNLACGSSAGKVYIITLRQQDGQLQDFQFQAHEVGINCLCWEPYKPDENLTFDLVERQINNLTKLITGSVDKSLKIWSLHIQNGQLQQNLIYEIKGIHGDWIRDIAWSPDSSNQYDIIASCSEDSIVIISKLQWDQNNRQYVNIENRIIDFVKFDGPTWRLNWNFDGSMLSISTAIQNNNNQLVVIQ